jgi:membrane-associated protein
MARFIPWVRSLTPLVAGMSLMPYRRFLYYNLIGGFIWVSFFVLGGYFFGNIPLVRDNLPLVIIAVVILSPLPAVVELVREKRPATS